MALGAQGVWTGSIWLTVEEYDLSAGKGIRDAFLRAESSDTVRTRIYTGKPARLLKTKWTEAWEAEDAPTPLPMPLQNLLVADAHNRMNRGDDPDTISMPVGQIVGRMNAGAPGRRGDGRPGRGVRGDHQAAAWHSRELIRSLFLACPGNAKRAPPRPRRRRPDPLATVLGVGNLMSATGSSFPAPTPKADCGPGARPETDIQGRVPTADYESGRAARGYLCNTRQVSHQGNTGGFKVLRYRDARATSARTTTRPCCSPRTCSSTPPRASASSCST